MTHFKNYKPFMAYLSQADIDKLKLFAKTTKVPMAQLIREAIAMRMAGENSFADGYTAGLLRAGEIVAGMKAAKMRFPSGASFAELVHDEIGKHMWRGNTKGKEDDESRSVEESM